MSDLIEREDAIKALYKYSFVSKDVIEREINAIPSADLNSEFSEWARHWFKDSADRPQGEWEDYDKYMKCCSKCGWIQDILHFGSNFCPNCGARMFAKDINVPNKEGVEE